MKHLRWIPPGSWPQVPIDLEDPEAGERDATQQEMLQMDLVPLGEHPDGGWIVDCLGREGREYPGRRVSPGGVERWITVSEDVAEICWHCTVHRREDGGDARADLPTDDRAVPRRSARGEGRLPQMDHRVPDPPELVAAARSREDTRRRRIPVREVRDEDVVEEGPVPGNTWAGEPRISPGRGRS